MTASLGSFPVFRAFDSNGDPLAGGLLYTYAAGGSVPLATYTSYAGTVPNANPVVLDANGEANVWFGSAAYKLVLKNSAGVTQWTADNYYANQGMAELADTASASFGDAMVGVKQPFTGSAARTQHSKNTDILTPEDFGAVGDGATDDSASLQSWLTACAGRSGSAPLGKTYKCDSTLVIPPDCTLDFGSSTIDFSGMTSNPAPTYACMSCNGTELVALPALAANIVKGSNTITLDSAPSVVAGDIILIYDSQDGSAATGKGFSGFRTYYRQGEMAEVASVAGAVITIKGDLYADYLLADGTVTVSKMGNQHLRINGGIFIGAESVVSYVLHPWLIRKVILDGCEFLDGYAQNVYLSNSWESHISNCKFIHQHVAGSSSYGLQIGNCQNVTVVNSDFASTRHGVSIGGGDYPRCWPIPNRNIAIMGCKFRTNDQGAAKALDCHGNAEYVKFIGNDAVGITLGGNHIEIASNHLRHNNGLILVSELSGFDYNIHDNHGEVTTSAADATDALFVELGVTSATSLTASSRFGGTFRVHHNIFRAMVAIDAARTSYAGINIRGRGVFPVGCKIDVSDNTLELPIDATRTNARALYVDVITATGATPFTFAGVRDNDIQGGAIAIRDSLSVQVKDNSIHDSESDHGIYVAQVNTTFDVAGVPKDVEIAGNLIAECGQSGIYVKGLSTGLWRSVRVQDNDIFNVAKLADGATDTRAVAYLQYITSARITGNFSTNTSANQLRKIAVANVTTLYRTGNDVTSAAGTENISATADRALAVGAVVTGATHNTAANEVEVFDGAGTSKGFMKLYTA